MSDVAQSHRESGDEPLVYRHKPKPVGYELVFRLDGDVLTVDSTRQVNRIKLGAVEQVRLVYAPTNLTRHGFAAELRLMDGRKLRMTNFSWRGITELERQDGEYLVFLRRLLPAIARANPQCRFLGGRGKAQWLGLSFLTGVTLLGMAVFAWRAYAQDHGTTALLALGLVGMGLWQIEPIVRLSRPRAVDPLDPPRELLP
jgi:hypothetical protein